MVEDIGWKGALGKIERQINVKRWVHECVKWWLTTWANPNCPNIEWLGTSATFGVQLFPNTLHSFHLHSAICDASMHIHIDGK